MLHKIYAKHSEKPLSQIVKSMERDNFMSANEAQDFGIIDKIIQSRDLMLV
jgi:ATP-dependent Clp protease protease subunit